MRKKTLCIFACMLAGVVLLCTENTTSAQTSKSLTYVLPSSHTEADYRTPIDWPQSKKPGNAQVNVTAGQFKLKNNLIEATWIVENNQLKFDQFMDITSGQSLDFSPVSAFVFDAATAGRIDAKDFVITKKPEIIPIAVDPRGARVADHVAGKAIRATLLQKISGIQIVWQAELRDGSNYIRQCYTISRPKAKTIETFNRVVMLRLPVPFVTDNALGTVPGSPLAVPGTNIIAGVEQPGYWAVADTANAKVTELSMPTQLVFNVGDQYQINTMIGYFPVEQRRRSFQYYIERERASRSRIYLHYNTWYDLSKLSDSTLIPVADAYYNELVKKRGVRLDGFVLDDGWDNVNEGLWQPDKTNFKKGFSALEQLLDTTSKAGLGLWISPCGGYGGQTERLNWAKKMGAEPQDAKTLDFAYIGYYKLFKELCLTYMTNNKVNYFKWDNAAPYENDGRTFGNLKSTSHFMRICQMSRELHRFNPDLFINTTVGTWPSPFWLNHLDCTWRMGGGDINWIGKGDNREREINFRDGEVYNMVVKRAPLYPLNSMMYHGVVLGHCYQGETVAKAGNNMTNEFRSYFALGANLQELYLSPDLMNAKAWDDLAECIKWNKKRASILIDSHWVSGDPNKGEPYCIASWKANQGVLSFRNPDDKPRNITFNVGTAFELPAGAALNYQLISPYGDQRIQKLDAKAGIPATITLQPFEVLVFDALSK